MRQAVLHRAGVLPGDEPIGNLDEGTRDDIMAILERMWRVHGLTLVTVTYDQDPATCALSVIVSVAL
jgi:putative ABC transport system ATP-binding protein